MSNTIEIDGIEVEVYRSKIDGRILIHIDTENGLDSDHHTPRGVPKLRVGVNDCYINLEPDGWVERD